MRSCNMTIEPAVEHGGPWGRDLFTFVTSAACHMMRTLQKPRKTRPSKRQVNHRRFLHNMIQRRFAEIDAGNHQLASALFPSARPNNQSDSQTPSQPTSNQSPEASKKGISVSPQTGGGAIQHEEAGDLWLLDTSTDATQEETVFQGHPQIHQRSQRLKTSHDTTTAGGSMSPDQTLKNPCQPSNLTCAKQLVTSNEETHSVSALTGLNSLPHSPNTLAVNDFSQWLARNDPGVSPHSLTSRSPLVPKELLHPSLDGVAFDFGSSSLDMSPLCFDTCDFGTAHHLPTPHPGNLQMDLRNSLDLFESEEEGSDQQDGQVSQITMATPWSSYFDRDSPFVIQNGSSHPNPQHNGCIAKQQVSISNLNAVISEVQDGGTYLTTVSNSSTHTANTADISQGTETQTGDLQISILVSDPEGSADNICGDIHMEVTRPSDHLCHLNCLSTCGQCTKGYEGEPEKRHLSHEELRMGHHSSYSPFSDVHDQGYSYYQTSSSCSLTVKDQGATLSTDLSRDSGEAFWVDMSIGATKPAPGTQVTMLDENNNERHFVFSQPEDVASVPQDYTADFVEVLPGFRPVMPGDVLQPEHTAVEANSTCIQAVGIRSCSEQLYGSRTSAHLSISSTDSSYSSSPGVQSSCLQNDLVSSPQCSTPFVGVAVSFPAPSQRPHLCQVATPPLDADLLFNDIIEEEMHANLTVGSCSFHSALDFQDFQHN